MWRTENGRKREAWRRAGRCIENLVRVFGDGWEAWNLDTAPEEVCTGMKLLQSSEKADVRERCQKSKVCDAGQFYETVSARQAVMAMSDLVARVRNRSDFDSATVFLHKKEGCSLEEYPMQGTDAGVSRWKNSKISLWSRCACHSQVWVVGSYEWTYCRLED